MDVRVAEARQTLGGFGGQCRAKFHAENLAGQTGQHRRLITKSRSNFQDALVPLQAKRRRHGRYDVWLRNGLAFSDGKRSILICAPAKFRGTNSCRGTRSRHSRSRLLVT